MIDNNSILQKLDGLEARYEEVSTLITDPSVIADQSRYVKLTKEYKDLGDIMDARRRYINCLTTIKEAKDIIANESDAAYWPYRGFLFEKLTLNRDVLSKLDLQEKSYNMMNGDFELRYKVTNEIINSFLELGDSDSLSVSLGGSNSNRGYYYSIVIENAQGYYFRETVSD